MTSRGFSVLKVRNQWGTHVGHWRIEWIYIFMFNAKEKRKKKIKTCKLLNPAVLKFKNSMVSLMVSVVLLYVFTVYVKNSCCWKTYCRNNKCKNETCLLFLFLFFSLGIAHISTWCFKAILEATESIFSISGCFRGIDRRSLQDMCYTYLFKCIDHMLPHVRLGLMDLMQQ